MKRSSDLPIFTEIILIFQSLSKPCRSAMQRFYRSSDHLQKNMTFYRFYFKKPRADLRQFAVFHKYRAHLMLIFVSLRVLIVYRFLCKSFRSASVYDFSKDRQLSACCKNFRRSADFLMFYKGRVKKIICRFLSKSCRSANLFKV